MNFGNDGVIARAHGVTLRCSGDTGLLIEFEQRIDLAVAARVQFLIEWLEQQRLEGVIEAVPGYCTVFIHYDPVVLPLSLLEQRVVDGLGKANLSPSKPSGSSRRIKIPVCYGGEFGPDLVDVAGLHNLSPDDVVSLHCNADYYVYFTGFLPSFPFLGGMSEDIATPRLREPRTKVAAGSVGIAGAQTGIYPLESPGGWRIIGRTPVSLFSLERDRPFLLQAGDWLRFVPIAESDFGHSAEEFE